MALDSSVLLASPVEVTFRLFDLIRTSSFWASIAFSLSRIFLGLLISIILSFVTAPLCAKYKILKILHEADIALQNSLTSAIKEWLEARGDSGTEIYIYTLSGKKYSLKEVLNEILLNSEIGQFFEKNINKLSIDLLSRSKEKIDD